MKYSAATAHPFLQPLFISAVMIINNFRFIELLIKLFQIKLSRFIGPRRSGEIASYESCPLFVHYDIEKRP